MAAGGEVVCGEAARKVEIEDKCGSGCGGSAAAVTVAAVDCNVGGDVNGNGGFEVSVGDTEGVNVDEFVMKTDSVDEVDQFEKEGLGLGKEVSETDVKAVKGDVNIENGSAVDTPVVLVTPDSTDEVDQFKKEGLGLGNEGVSVDPLVSETDVKAVKGDVNIENGSAVDTPVVHVTPDSTDEVDQLKKEELGLGNEGVPVDPLVLETDVKAVKGDVNIENGSAVDGSVVLVTNGVAQDVNGGFDKISGEEEAGVKSMGEVDGTEEEDIGSGLTFVPESTLSTIESSQVTVSELEAVIKPTDVTVSAADYEVMVNDGPESVINLIVTVDGSGKTSEDLEFEVTDDGSESSGSLIEEQEGQATVDVSGKPSEDLGSQVTPDERESCKSPIKERECEVLVDGSDSIGCLVDNQESPVSVDESEPNANHTEKVDGKSEEHQELLVISSEVSVEAEPDHACSVIKAENKKGSGLVLSEEVDALVNGQVEKCDRILEMGETQISGTEVDGSTQELLKVTEFVEMEMNTEEMKEQVKVEDEIPESQRVVIDNVQDKLNLEDNTAESANETEVSLESNSQYEVSNCIDKPQEGLQPEASAENVDTEQKVEIVSHVGTENRAAEGTVCGTGFENVNVSDDNETETEIKDAKDASHSVTEISSDEGMDCGTQVENVVVFDDEEKETEVKDMDCETGVKNVDFPDKEKESEVNDASFEDHSTLSFFDTIVKRGVVIEFGSIGRHEATPSIRQNVEVEDMNGIQNDEIPNSSVEGEVNVAIDAQHEEVEVLEYNFLVKIPRFEDESFRDQIRSAYALVEEKTHLRDSIRNAILERRDRLRACNQEYGAAKKKEIAARRVVKSKRQEIESVQAVINRWKNAMSVEDIDSRIFGAEYMIQHETILLKDEKEFIREIRQLKSLRDQLASNMGTPEEIRHAIDMKDHNEERLKVLRKELEALKAKVSKVVAVLETIVKKYEAISAEERELQYQFRAADVVRQKAYGPLNSLKKLLHDKNKNFRQFKEDLTTAKTFLSQGDKDALHRLCANQVETFMEQWNNNDEFRQEYINRCNCIASRKQKALDGAPLVPDEVAPVLPSNVNEKVDRSPVSIPGEVKHVAVVLPVEQEKDVSSTAHKNAYNNDTRESIEKVSGQKKQELKNKSVAKPTNLGSDDVTKEETKVAVVAEVAENMLTKEEIELAKKACSFSLVVVAEVAVVAEVTENMLTKEEIELARKAEELRKEEIAAKLKEQRRLEEKAKAIEALERKKRNAEKAQLRAELRARKEAEQKEKEKEKRLRKKEKKTGGGDGSINGEEGAGSESSNEATAKEIEAAAANKKKTKKPPAHFFSKTLKPKPVPPPILNKNKRRLQQLGRLALAALAVLVVFLLANFGLIFNYKPNVKFNMPH